MNEIEDNISEDTPIRLNYIDVSEYMKKMEELANAPKEEYGKRQPGERGMYEIQRENKLGKV